MPNTKIPRNLCSGSVRQLNKRNYSEEKRTVLCFFFSECGRRGFPEFQGGAVPVAE